MTHTRNLKVSNDGASLFDDVATPTRTIGTAYGWEFPPTKDGPVPPPTAEALANARLWAASPQLLEQAIKAAKALEYSAECAFDSGWRATGEMMRGHAAALQAVIDAATGVQS